MPVAHPVILEYKSIGASTTERQNMPTPQRSATLSGQMSGRPSISRASGGALTCGRMTVTSWWGLQKKDAANLVLMRDRGADKSIFQQANASELVKYFTKQFCQLLMAT